MIMWRQNVSLTSFYINLKRDIHFVNAWALAYINDANFQLKILKNWFPRWYTKNEALIFRI